MKWLRSFVSATLFAASVLSIALPAGAAPHELRFANGDDVTTLNPALSATTTVGLLSQLSMAYLVRYDAKNRPIPELATTVPTQADGGISRDGKTITWHLRPGARWSDGVAFNSSDVAFSVSVMQNSVDRVVSHDGFDLIDRVDTPDRVTAIFHLRRPYAGFLPRYFGSAPGNPALLPRHVLGSLPDINSAPYNALPIGIGPFRYVRLNRGDSIEMEANPFYFRGLPKLRKIEYEIVPSGGVALTQLQSGDVDLVLNVGPADVPRMQADPRLVVTRSPGYRFIALVFNTSGQVLKDSVVRTALRLATDRRALVDKVDHGLGVVTESFVPPQYAEYEPLPFVPYDIAKADSALDVAGWARGSGGVRSKNGVRLSIDFDTVAAAYPQDVEQIRSSWTQIGVDLQTKTYQPNAFYQPGSGVLFGGGFDATIIGIANFPFLDPGLIFSCARIPPGGLNVSRYCDRTTDSLIADYESTYDPSRQTADLRAVARRIDEQVPLVVLNYAENSFAAAKTVTGFHPNDVTFFDDVMKLDVR